MISVSVKNQSKYPVNVDEIERCLSTLLEQRGIVSNTKVSVALVGKKQMLDISRKYLKDDKVHNVLSFTYSEVSDKFIFPPDNSVHLGEIIVCYPKANDEAKAEKVDTEEKIKELVKHGALHLIGIHHD
ncbi:rRNA maturation RNase YbeY [Patescibacteria group bacterium]|nr:rRNA maturation RNase YbeY [Patescibacteria group bacterium]MBU0777161.1 rRNA maturation RNase YbeY [Patescibacteria group bacterium]MBU0845855.1 rRNA maturation RNase YbeY [Patescibacteria group bacterium]MBU0922882.1 rRNA maturation RNase YbeY [Patescibacteria group bacterium]MBU1066385.1 rRNA maturation RNase YbeY [Patescibacteria group bacterium]